MFGIFSIWRTFNAVIFYLTLAVCLAGLVGNGLVLWNLGFRIKKGPFNTYLLHLAAADFLFVSCQLGFPVTQAAMGASQAQLGALQDTLYFVITFLWFAVGLWLLAAFCTECCLTSLLPSCYQRYRPRHTSAALCVLAWVLTLPAVLLPAHACGLLRSSSRLLACLGYHSASVTWLAVLLCTAWGTSLVLLVWVSCCSQQPPPKFYSIARSSGILLLLCRLPLVIYWSLRVLLNFLLPVFPPLAVLLACFDSSFKPLLYFMVGRQPGKREPFGMVLHKALGQGGELKLRGLSLPMARV